jgi:hypothetical protein
MGPSSWGGTPKNLPLKTKTTTTWETQEVPMTS